MELEFTTEQEELRSSVRMFLQKECPVDAVRAVVETGEEPEKLWDSMVALDWPALAVPEEYGGVGLTIVETAVLAEELGRAIAPGPLLATVTQFAPMLREVGTPGQQERFLSGVASGRYHRRSGARRPSARVGSRRRHHDRRAGGGWLGPRRHQSGGPRWRRHDRARRRRPCRRGHGCLRRPRRRVGPPAVHSLDASRPLATATLHRVLVPDDRALGEPGSAPATAGITRALQEATVGLALETVGASDALFQMVLAYVKDRRQFGVPIGSFQAVKHKMSNMYLSLERARSLCYFAVAAIDEDTPARASAVSMAKAASDDCQRLVGRESIQSFGGIGYTWEHDGHLFLKRAETSAALFGGSAQHSLAVAATLGLGSS